MNPLDSIAPPAANPWAAPAPSPQGSLDAEQVIFLACYACNGKLRLKRKHLGISGACVFCRVPVVAWERLDLSGASHYFSAPPQIEPPPPVSSPSPPAAEMPPPPSSEPPRPVADSLAAAPLPLSSVPVSFPSSPAAAPPPDNRLPLPAHSPPAFQAPPFVPPGPQPPPSHPTSWQPPSPISTPKPPPQIGFEPLPQANDRTWTAVEFPSSAQKRARGPWIQILFALVILGGLGYTVWWKWDVIVPALREWLMPAKLNSPSTGLEQPPVGSQQAKVVTRPYVFPQTPGISPEEMLEASGRKLLERFYLGGTILERMSSVIPSPGVETAMTNYYARYTEMPVLAHADWVGRMRDPGSGLWFGVFDVKESTSDRDFRWCVVEVTSGSFLLDWQLHQQLADDLLGRFMADNGSTDVDLTLILRRGGELKDEDNPWKPDSGIEVFLSLPLSKDRAMPQRVVLSSADFKRMGLEEKLVGNTTRIARVRLGWIASPSDPLIRYPIIEECYSWGAWDAHVADQVMAQGEA